MQPLTTLLMTLTMCLALCGTTQGEDGVRFMTFNIQDLRPEAVFAKREQVRESVAIIRASGASVVLVNEMAHTPDGRHCAHFAQMLGEGTDHTWSYLAMPSNTGEHAGMDFDNNGASSADDEGRDYGGDCYGYGEFPGHYAMALFVRSDVQVDWEGVRTLRKVLWKDMPGAMLPPMDGDGNGSWYSDEELGVFRLSSKSHWDVPVVLADGQRVHLLCSHPTPPGFDGDEDRNGRRNHDEIRLWLDYIDGAEWIVDDAGARGGLAPGASFIVMGDLNADPVDGSSRDSPAAKLLAHPRVNGDFAPTSEVPGTSRRRVAWDGTDTAVWGLRVGYAQPSADLRVLDGGVIRGDKDLPGTLPDGFSASDHFPVWVEIAFEGP